jgi:hypothetical protein
MCYLTDYPGAMLVHGISRTPEGFNRLWLAKYVGSRVHRGKIRSNQTNATLCFAHPVINQPLTGQTRQTLDVPHGVMRAAENPVPNGHIADGNRRKQVRKLL